MVALGITGHQRLADESAWPWVQRALAEQLAQAARPLVVISSLAIGADQVGARLALVMGGSVRAVLPFPDIERTFDSEGLREFLVLRSRAEVEVLDASGSDETAFLAAGRRVVDLADRMIAVWDGAPARGKGGTADIVAYARSVGVPVVQIDPVQRSVRELER